MTSREWLNRLASDRLLRADYAMDQFCLKTWPYILGLPTLLYGFVILGDYVNGTFHFYTHFLCISSLLLVYACYDAYKKYNNRWYAKYGEAYREALGQPSEPAAPPTDTKTLAAAKILSELPIPQHLHYLFRPSIEWLLSDAASVPGWSFEKVKPIIVEKFIEFIQNLKRFYKIPNQPTLFSVPFMQAVEWGAPSILYFGGDLFPRYDKYITRHFEKWEQEKKKEAQTNEELIDYWVGGTRMAGIFSSSLPYDLPHDQRFAGMLLAIPSKGGKTNLLNGLIRENLDDVANGRASVIIMDSKAEQTENLIDRWRNVDFARIDPRLGGRVHIFDPENDIQMNLLDGDITDVIERLEYVLPPTTTLQSTLLRSVLFLAKATPNPSIAMLSDILQRGWQPYAHYVNKLEPDDKAFFTKPQDDGTRNPKSDFDSKTYADTKNQLRWRLKDLSDRAPALRGTIRAASSRVNLRELVDGGNIIIINAKTHPSEPSIPVLGEPGSAFWMRLWIAELLRAARTRKKRIPVYFYCDEAARALDEKIATIIDECRSSMIATTIAYQGQLLDDPKVTAALRRCAIILEGQGKPGHFKATIRGEGTLDLTAVLTNVSALPQLTKERAAALKEEMRRRYGARSESRKTEYPEEAAKEEDTPRKARKPEGPIIDAEWEDITEEEDERPRRRRLPPPNPAGASTDYDL